MKLLLVLLLGGIGSMAMANDQDSQTAQITVEPYRYSQSLDIAHVVAVSPVPNVCDVVPMQLTYDDSHGERHIMEYRIMGDGCSDN